MPSTAYEAGVVFANELLDAFPVHRVAVRDGRLLELFVSVNDENGFIWTEREPSTSRLAEYLANSGVELAEGQIAEINLDAAQWLSRAASIFKRGFLIIVDYGAEASDLYAAPDRFGGTLRAFHRHVVADDLLARPGEQDLTTTIDWSNVRKAGEEFGLGTVSFARQDEFLLRAGILERLERLASDASSESEALILRSSVRDLILPGGMSESFQVLVLRIEEDAH
jgi:SAM-dependent MidA family methyltransferase